MQPQEEVVQPTKQFQQQPTQQQQPIQQQPIQQQPIQEQPIQQQPFQQQQQPTQQPTQQPQIQTTTFRTTTTIITPAKNESGDVPTQTKETMIWDVAEYGGYIFQKSRPFHPVPLHHSQSQPQIAPIAAGSSNLQQQEPATISPTQQQTIEEESNGGGDSTSSTPLNLSHSSIGGGGRKQYSFDDHCALIVANQKLPRKLVDFFWDKCSVKICADGGANRLYSLSTKLNQVNKWIPDYIKGDLDSLHEGVSDFFSKKGSTIVLDSNQDTSDLQKCFELIVDLEKNSGVKYRKVFILGGLGGSFSHEFSNLNTLFNHMDRKIILLSKDNIAWLLNSNYNHTILCHPETKCSLIPIASKVSDVTTNGLKWNLVNQGLNFGELISTSNVSLENKVTVELSNPLVYIVDINP